LHKGVAQVEDLPPIAVVLIDQLLDFQQLLSSRAMRIYFQAEGRQLGVFNEIGFLADLIE
jgi:hypothetical protein